MSREKRHIIALNTLQYKMINCKNERPFKFKHLTVRQFSYYILMYVCMYVLPDDGLFRPKHVVR